MTTMTTEQPMKLDPAELAQFTGTMQYYAMTLLRRRFLATEGMHYVAEAAEAHWLLDLVASYLATKPLNRSCRGFQVWRLRKLGPECQNQAEATCWTDTPDKSKRVVRQLIPMTDFPFEDVGGEFIFWVEGLGTPDSPWVALLPSEH